MCSYLYRQSGHDFNLGTYGPNTSYVNILPLIEFEKRQMSAGYRRRCKTQQLLAKRIAIPRIDRRLDTQTILSEWRQWPCRSAAAHQLPAKDKLDKQQHLHQQQQQRARVSVTSRSLTFPPTSTKTGRSGAGSHEEASPYQASRYDSPESNEDNDYDDIVVPQETVFITERSRRP